MSLLSDVNFLTQDLLDVANFVHSRCFCTWYETVRAILPSGFFYSLRARWSFNCSFSGVLSSEEELFLEYIKGLAEKKSLDVLVNQFLMDYKYKHILEKLIEKKVLLKTDYYKRRILNKKDSLVKVSENIVFGFKLTKKQKVLFDYIKSCGEVSLKKACYVCGVTNIVAKNLENIGAITIFEKDIYRNPYSNVSKTRNVEDIKLNAEQQVAADGLLGLLKKGEPGVALLMGVTGSGKTQVFLKVIDFVLKCGKDVIFLVPEISLTPQMVLFFQSFFGQSVAVLHSGILASQRLDEYRRIFKGLARLVIGTRSAVFAPCKNLGLIIMDEEEGACYKSSDMSPRYDAKDIAKYRAFKTSSLLILASATPSISTSYYAKKGIYSEFVLKNRYKNIELPRVFVVDMKKASMSLIPGVSEYLFGELAKNLERNEQSIIFLNRRGYYLSVVCLDCGFGVHCKNCSALMVYHSVNKTFMCHYCGYILTELKCCSNCKSERLFYCGEGTQNVEQHIKKHLKCAKVLRLDTDSVFSHTDLEEKIKAFENGEYNILIGTQMVAKGLNFLNVSLVGVLSADSVLYGADFKSVERAFCLLTQVVGRSGRAKKQGRAIIQTVNPSNKVIAWAARQDYDKFYENEIEERKAFFCPPFCDFCIVNFIGKDKDRLYICAKEFIEECRKNANLNVPFLLLGISTPYLEMLNKRYRKRVIIKCRNSSRFREWMRCVALKAFSSKNFATIRVNIDINGDIL